MQTIKLGSRGSDVKKLQKFLGLTEDGVFGAETLRKLTEWQSKNGLVADGVCGVRTWALIIEKSASVITLVAPLTRNITKCTKRDIKYIVIHFTAGTTSKVGTAFNTRNYFQKSTRGASADFVVDDDTVVQCTPDIRTYYTWQCGDGNGKYGITNRNSIGIEMCSTLEAGTTLNASNHSGWKITESVLHLTAELVVYLIKQLNVDIDHVVCHYDASRKNCPGVLGWNEGEITDARTGKKTGQKNNRNEWLKFKERIKKLL